MQSVEQWAELRRLHFVQGVSIKELHRRTGLHRDTIRRALRSSEPPRYERPAAPSKLDPFKDEIHRLLREDPKLPNVRIAELDIGSRPARRSEAPDVASLRAIPWVFAWSQTRANLPGWFGLGSGLAAIADRPGGPQRLREMVAGWPFFAGLLENAELSLAKGEPVIARRYLELGGQPQLAEAIEREHELTERMVLAATGQPPHME